MQAGIPKKKMRTAQFSRGNCLIPSESQRAAVGTHGSAAGFF
jgi:hypothetical protein